MRLLGDVNVSMLILMILSWSGCRVREGAPEIVPIEPGDLPSHFTETGRQSNPRVQVTFIDLDGDLVDESLTFTTGDSLQPSTILAASHTGTIIDQVNLPNAKEITFQFAQDVNLDGDKDVFVVTREEEDLYLSAVDIYHTAHSTFLKRFKLHLPAAYPQSYAPDQQVKFVKLLEADKTHPAMLIGSCISGYSKGPRGILAVELETGQPLWFFAMGPNPTNVIVSEEEPPCIYVGCSAPDNGISANGTDDSHVYIFGLTLDGKPRWKPKRLGEKFSSTRVYLEDLNNDGENELLCLFTSASKAIEKSALRVYHTKTGAQIGSTREFDQTVLLGDQSPLIKDGFKEQIVLCSMNGMLYLLGKDLEPIQTKQLPAKVTGIQYTDIDADGRKDLILTLNSNETLILDQTMSPVARIGGSYSVTCTNCNQRAEQSLVLNRADEIITGILEKKPPRIDRWLLLAGALLLLLGMAYGSYRAMFYIQVVKQAPHTSPRLFFMLINRRGKILFVNPSFSQKFSTPVRSLRKKHWSLPLEGETYSPLRQYLASVLPAQNFTESRLDIGSAGGSRNLLVRTHPMTFLHRFKAGSLIAIYDISEQLEKERMLHWASIAQNLAHEMKTPLSTMWFTIERLRQMGTAGESRGAEAAYLQSLEEEIRRLDRYVKGFMKLASITPPNLQENDLNQVLEDHLSEYSKKLPSSTTLKKELASDLPNVKLDVNLFTIALTNLLDNAVTAMQGTGVLRVSTYLARKLSQDHVHLAVSDTGSGIASADISKIFQPYFSKTDGGTGLGLIYTKKIIEDHGGTISFTTREGLGTEFVIELPVPAMDPGGRFAP